MNGKVVRNISASNIKRMTDRDEHGCFGRAPRLPLSIVASLLVPPAIQIVFAAVIEAAPRGEPFREDLLLVMVIGFMFSSVCGYWILTRGWATKAKIIGGVVYFPVMIPILIYTHLILYFKLFGPSRT